jgi:hypothetical protein
MRLPTVPAFLALTSSLILPSLAQDFIFGAAIVTHPTRCSDPNESPQPFRLSAKADNNPVRFSINEAFLRVEHLDSRCTLSMSAEEPGEGGEIFLSDGDCSFLQKFEFPIPIKTVTLRCL